MSRWLQSPCGLTAWVALICVAASAMAVAPTPEAVAKWKAEGIYDQVIAQWEAFHKAGGDSPSQYPAFDKKRMQAATSAGVNAPVDTINVPVVLIYFSDKALTAAGTAQAFDSILFSNSQTDSVVNLTGSLTDYYLENSYGKLLIRGHVYGPYIMPFTYSHYVGSDHGLSESGSLASDAAAAADHDIDYHLYANSYNMVPGLIVIHAGLGGEQGGNDIWSNRGSLSGPSVFDGVLVDGYTLNPELFAVGGVTQVLSPIGVFCHEYGHVLGLPDLYDVNYTAGSEGIGVWSLMASGNYNSNAQKPAHLDAWCKEQLNFVSYTYVSANQYQAAIPEVEFNPVVYRIDGNDYRIDNSEYWLVENREKVGFDAGLPGQGLLIYHIDNTVQTNTNPNRYHVALEQADGLNGLAFGSSRGDAGDPWPGSTGNRNFNDQSNPNSRSNSYPTSATEVGVWRISDPDSIMHADFDSTFSRPYLKLETVDSLKLLDNNPGDNNDGILDGGETINFYCTVEDFMRITGYWYVTLQTTNPNITFVQNGVKQQGFLNPNFGPILGQNPVKFTIAPGIQPTIADFQLIIQADSLYGVAGDKTWADTFNIQISLGAPQVLVIDDDNDTTLQQVYTNSLHNFRLPYAVWDKYTYGSPSAATMNKYPNAIWMTGDTLNGGTLNTSDVASMKAYLDAGHHLAITSITAPHQLAVLDSAFLWNYMHCFWKDTVHMIPFFHGVAGNVVGDTMSYRFSVSRYGGGLVNPANSGSAAMYYTNVGRTANYGNCGVTYDGAYRTFIWAYGLEFVSDNFTVNSWAIKDTLMGRILKFFVSGSATGITDNPGGDLPTSFVLKQNYPNPFNPETQISYTLAPTTGNNHGPIRTDLSIYNLLGQRVVTLVDAVQPAGTYHVVWKGTDSQGNKVASGVYFYRLARGEESQARKMMLLK